MIDHAENAGRIWEIWHKYDGDTARARYLINTLLRLHKLRVSVELRIGGQSFYWLGKGHQDKRALMEAYAEYGARKALTA